MCASMATSLSGASPMASSPRADRDALKVNRFGAGFDDRSAALLPPCEFKLGATFALSSLSPAVIVRAWRSCQLPAISANVGEGVR